MKIIEHMQNIFVKKSKPVVPSFPRNASFDTVLLFHTFGVVPEVVRARDGLMYIYFEITDENKINIVRAMGFNPRLHKSQKYFPARKIYRALVSSDMPKDVRNVVNKLVIVSKGGIWEFLDEVNKSEASEEYQKYIANYKLSSQQKTK